MSGAELLPNARNFRRHPEQQALALREVLEEIGQAGELLAYHSARNGGKLTLVDGHLRAEQYAEQDWDVAITDLTDEEADKLLLVHDPLGAMAEVDTEALQLLIDEAAPDGPALQKMLDDLQAANAGEVEEEAPAAQPTDPVLGSMEYKIIVKCLNETQQSELLERFHAEGLEVQALII